MAAVSPGVEPPDRTAKIYCFVCQEYKSSEGATLGRRSWLGDWKHVCATCRCRKDIQTIEEVERS